MGYKHLQFDKDSVFLVTGGAGFIGSNLCEEILDMGYQVRCLDDLSTGKQENVEMFLDRPGITTARLPSLFSALRIIPSLTIPFSFRGAR
ncbi:MAG: NAD-dependent epimerase/dehydratase family protein, partial [Eisenbergiella porci]|uniref:NAD-dependent epimerase/dehydratase family protein n=1 Tax=Eisenbergiella porci TaxID=2652274 RepID=UPI002A74EF9E